MAEPCGCVEVQDEEAARAAGVLEHYERQRSYGVTGPVIVQCEEHRARTIASIAALDDREDRERERLMRKAMDYEIDDVVCGRKRRS